jgi:hypothetical protein
VYVNGAFNGYCGYCNPLSDANNDGVWEVTLPLYQASYEYKFTINGFNSQENLTIGTSCTNTTYDGSNVYTNRTLVVGNTDQVLPIVCWNYCTTCDNLPKNVTFRVDMSQVSGFNPASDVVYVNGAFNGYCGPCNPLSDANNDGVYEVTLLLNQASYEYKFTLNGWSSQENLTIGSSCTNTTYDGPNVYTNRTLVVGNANQVLPIVCWNSCTNCGYAVSNDSPYSAVNVQYSSNAAYPNCYAINGSTANATDSPQSAGFSGKDTWYKFTAQSTGVSISLTGSGQDDAIALYSKSGSSFNLMSGGVENATSGASDFERLNYTGLTPGTVYYVSVGAPDATTSGAFALCIQHLMPSGCSYTEPAGGFNLCNSWKATYRGAPSTNGVTYTFNFTGVGGNAATPFATTTLSGTNGLTTLSNPAFGLRYGGEYDASVDVVYTLNPSSGPAEVITVIGAATGNCNDVSIMQIPSMEIISSQRCPATLFRSSWLRAARLSNSANVCGVTNYTYEFTQIAGATGCAGGDPIDVIGTPYTTTGTSPYLQLGVLPTGINQGVWDVRVRSNFGSGASAYSSSYGPTQRIQINGTAASGELGFEVLNAERDEEMVDATASIYPNPNNGDFVNVNLSNLEKGNLQVRVLDAAGRAVVTRLYSVESSLQTALLFDTKLSTGLYMMEMTNAGNMQTQRLIVQ